MTANAMPLDADMKKPQVLAHHGAEQTEQTNAHEATLGYAVDVRKLYLETLIKTDDLLSLPASCLDDIDTLLHALAKELPDRDSHAHRLLRTARYLCEDWSRLLRDQQAEYTRAIEALTQRPVLN